MWGVMIFPERTLSQPKLQYVWFTHGKLDLQQYERHFETNKAQSMGHLE